MRYAFIGLLLVCVSLFAACSSDSKNTMSETRSEIRFDVRGLKNEANESSLFTTFSHKGNIIPMGDSSACKQPYLVLVKISRISGGDPERQNVFPFNAIIPIVDGIGEFEIPGGMREKRTAYSSGATWEPEKIEINVVGYIPATALAGVVARTP